MKLYHNGTILTMTDSPAPQALLTDGGVIAALGSYDELKPRASEEVDLQGRTLLPAFIDPHSHITSLALTAGLCQLGGVSSFDELVDALRAFGADKDPQFSVMGFGYDHNVLAERAHPTRQVLDRAFPDRPVLVTHASGHMGVANTAALALLGVTADTPDPSGGHIGREADGRTPNGYLEENAFIGLSSHLPMAPSDPLEGLTKAQQVYLSHGITLVQDGLTGQPSYRLLSKAAQAGALTVDVVGYADQKKAPELSEAPQWQHKIDHFKLGGYKIFLDGSPQGRTAWMLEPYLGGDGSYKGYPIYTDQEVTGFVRAALEQGVQILAHCNGDAAAAQYIRCCRAAQAETGKSLRDIRPVMIHAQLVHREQLEEMAALGIIPSFFAAHVWYWGDVHMENFGAHRAASISPLAEALKLGLPFTLHQDTPVIQPNMLESVWCAVNRVTRHGTVLGPEYRISPREALKAVTVNAAYQYGLEAERGTLEAGKAADFVILDRDPTAVEPMEIREIRVLETVKDGETVFQG